MSKTVPIIKSYLKIQDFTTSKKKTKLSKAKVKKGVSEALKYQEMAWKFERPYDRNRMLRKSNKILAQLLKKIEKESSRETRKS